MKRTHRSASRLLTVVAASMLLASACGTERSTSGGGADGAAAPADATADTPAEPPRHTEPDHSEPTAAPSTPTDATTPDVPVDDPIGPTAAPPRDTAAAPVGEAQPLPDPEPCGSFGQLPPRPDSMPTRLWDTDGDGDEDDAVTVYGAVDGFRVRVQENGVTSEAIVPPVTGFAGQIDPRPTDDGDHPRVHDLETDVVFEFATDDTGCVELVSTIEPPAPAGPIDDLAPTPLPEPIDGPCGTILPLGPDATIATDEVHDFFADGSPEHTITYVRDGRWYLRVVHEHGPVEIEIDDVGPGYVDVLGLADVNHEAGGSEVMVRVGSTASHVKVGVVTFLEGGCLFQMRGSDESPFTFLVGATVTSGEAAICYDGSIELIGYNEDANAPGTYVEAWAAFHGVDHLHMGYLPASDGFAEGLTADEVVPADFYCNGLPL